VPRRDRSSCPPGEAGCRDPWTPLADLLISPTPAEQQSNATAMPTACRYSLASNSSLHVLLRCKSLPRQRPTPSTTVQTADHRFARGSCRSSLQTLFCWLTFYLPVHPDHPVIPSNEASSNGRSAELTRNSCDRQYPWPTNWLESTGHDKPFRTRDLARPGRNLARRARRKWKGWLERQFLRFAQIATWAYVVVVIVVWLLLHLAATVGGPPPCSCLVAAWLGLLPVLVLVPLAVVLRPALLRPITHGQSAVPVWRDGLYQESPGRGTFVSGSIASPVRCRVLPDVR